MTFSFVATPNAARPLTASLAPLQSRGEILELSGWQLWLKSWGRTRITEILHVENSRTHVLIGAPTNIEELRSLATLATAEALSASSVHILVILREAFGDAVLSLVEGPFTVLTFGPRGKLTVVTDALGLQPVHTVRGRCLWISSELKNIGLCGPGEFKFMLEEDVVAHDNRPDSFLPISNAERIRPGSICSFSFDGRGHSVVNCSQYVTFRLAIPQRIKREQARLATYSLLSASIRNVADVKDSISIPLSGGLDSSLVTALAAQCRADIKTFAIGTEVSNEFEFAQTVAHHVRTAHHDLTFGDDAILQGAHEAIFYNEIFDGLSAEIQASLLCLYRSLEGTGGRIVTGYGSDLLFGGVLRPGSAPNDANAELWRQIYRTRWTGEFSQFGANRYGFEVHHPFWTPRLMGFALSLAPEMKVSVDEVKVMLRECAAENALLPEEIVWRRKIGIHEGSSVNSIFASHIGVAPGDYAAKTRYTYAKFRAYMSAEDAPDAGDNV
ncbi:asparagine synthase C-terminal domain-containing protein [Caballeronia sp. ATUFL_M2_KS44]|uniref:asparagine synthase C-terminal domain-containing protein n=1 Tax=Caballeronia sp. ATUFL_M2_KS44 TaxID=2921767 RepID=UPI002028C901|nr:asparagine synthase C-terminal domain-containing protein [Caballeronia sp. ATUFL_M2_KS44]